MYFVLLIVYTLDLGCSVARPIQLQDILHNKTPVG